MNVSDLSDVLIFCPGFFYTQSSAYSFTAAAKRLGVSPLNQTNHRLSNICTYIVHISFTAAAKGLGVSPLNQTNHRLSNIRT